MTLNDVKVSAWQTFSEFSLLGVVLGHHVFLDFLEVQGTFTA